MSHTEGWTGPTTGVRTQESQLDRDEHVAGRGLLPDSVVWSIGRSSGPDGQEARPSGAGLRIGRVYLIVSLTVSIGLTLSFTIQSGIPDAFLLGFENMQT